MPRLRFGGKTINTEGGETISIIKINKLKHNPQMKDSENIVIITHKTTKKKKKKTIT